MANIAHRSLTGDDLHEPKGAASAGAATVYVANGGGTGVWTAVSSLLSAATVSAISGEVDDGVTLPLPPGFILSECAYIVSPRELETTDVLLNCYVDVTGVVVAQVRRTVDEVTTTESISANYLVIGVG